MSERQGLQGLELTQAELGIWLGHQSAADPSIYNAAQGVRLRGALDVPAFERALADTLGEGCSSWLRFVELEGAPVKVPGRAPRPALSFVDLSREAQPQLLLEQRVARELQRAFELADGVLARHHLFRLSADEHVWLHVAHHIALDGYGFDLVARRVAERYLRRPEARPLLPWGELSAVLRADRDYEASTARADDRRFWLEQLRDLEEVQLGEPTSAPAHALSARRLLGAAQLAALGELQQLAGVDVSSALMAVVAKLIAERTGARRFALGAPVMLRLGTPAVSTPCMAMNILALPVRVSPDTTLASLASELGESSRRAKPHQRYRYEQLKRERELGGRRPFGPVVNVIPFGGPRRFEGCAAEPFGVSAGPVEDVSFAFVKRGDAFELTVDAHPAGMTRGELEALADDVVRRVSECASTASSSIAMPAPPARALSLVETLVAQARERPAAPALIDAELELNYAELLQAARGASAFLRDAYAGASGVVALELPRGATAVVLLLGALWSGLGYSVLDPRWPAARRRDLIERLGPALWVRRAGADALPEQHASPVLELPERALQAWRELGAKLDTAPSPPTPGQPAYVVFTSGSTGEPKGVAVGHDALAAFLAAALPAYGFVASDRVLQFAALSFDASVEEIGVTWAAGATLMLRDESMLESLAAFSARCEELRVSVLDLPTAFWHELCFALREGVARLPGCVRLVIVGGEAVLEQRLRDFRAAAPGVRLLNTYGPSEATIVATVADLSAWEAGDAVTIGRPLAGVVASVRDARGAPVAPGATGELYLGGATLALGYHRAPELTRARFRSLSGLGRAYQTGDLVVQQADGQLVYVGRSDDEIKLSGVRISPAEIEAALSRHPAVRASVVLAVRAASGELRLAAHVEADAERVDGAELRRFLAESLPSAMLPSIFELRAALPRSAHGKLDRAALRGAASAEAPPAVPSVAPDSELGRVLAAWQEVLGVAAAPDDDFFAVGGTSLQLIQLANRLSRGGRAISVASVFRYPTPRQQLELLRGGAHALDRFSPAKVELDARAFAKRPPERERGGVLLTGASGFLGVHLLDQLLRATDATISIALRDADPDAGLRRVLERATEQGLSLQPHLSRIRALPIGELSGLGERLASATPACGAIVSCAAEVSLTRSYQSLLAANVLLPRELLELAGRWGAELHHVSSVAAVPDGAAENGVVAEAFFELGRGLSDGYRQTKWHAEQLCARAGAWGLATAVYRLGRVAPSSTEPRVNPRDLLWRVVRAALHCRAWPELDVTEPWIAVDAAARAIVALMQRGAARAPAQVYHLLHTGLVGWSDVHAALARCGQTLPRVSLATWRALVREHGDAEDLTTLAFFDGLGDASGASAPEFACERAKELWPEAAREPAAASLLEEQLRAVLAHSTFGS